VGAGVGAGAGFGAGVGVGAGAGAGAGVDGVGESAGGVAVPPHALSNRMPITRIAKNIFFTLSSC